MSNGRKFASRNWCWTAFPMDGVYAHPRMGDPNLSYVVWGDELTEDLKPHHQGYSEYDIPMRFTTLKNLYPQLHLEPRGGSQKQAIDYCKKDGHVTEQGTPKQQGKRSDIHDVCELLDEKVPLNEIARNHPSAFVKHAKGFHAYKFATQVDRVSKPYVEWRWGTTGTGKTKGAIDKHPESFYIKDGTQWWDGYEQQDAIIIDDFDGRWPFRDLLRLLDWNPYQGQTKGGYVKINSPHIYITCEFEPSTYWGGNALAQVLRRIDKVEHLATAATEVAGNTIQPLLKRQGAVILNQAYDDLEQYGDDGNLWIK